MGAQDKDGERDHRVLQGKRCSTSHYRLLHTPHIKTSHPTPKLHLCDTFRQSLGSVMVSILGMARGVGSNPVLDVLFPMFITHMILVSVTKISVQAIYPVWL